MASRPDGRARRSLLTRRSPPPDVGGWRSRGKALPIFGSHVKRKICPNRKYFCFTESKSRLHLNPSRPGKRGVAHVTNARWDAVDAMRALDERVCGVRQRRVVLTSRCWRQCTWRQLLSGRYGGKRAVLRGEPVISRKAIAQGRPGCSRWTCMLVCAFPTTHAHETAGAARTRSSLRPLFEEGKEISGKARAHRAARSRTLPSLRGATCPPKPWRRRKQSMSQHEGSVDCFGRFAPRNDDLAV